MGAALIRLHPKDNVLIAREPLTLGATVNADGISIKVRAQVGKDFDMKHFTPSYNPWDERLCAVPNGDLFKVLRKGQGSVVTDHIETFTETGIQLKSGKTLEADIIVTATGLNLIFMNGVNVSIDGAKVDPGKLLNYTMDRHCEVEGRPYLGIELRQNEVATVAQQAEWAARLARISSSP